MIEIPGDCRCYIRGDRLEVRRGSSGMNYVVNDSSIYLTIAGSTIKYLYTFGEEPITFGSNSTADGLSVIQIDTADSAMAVIAVMDHFYTGISDLGSIMSLVSRVSGTPGPFPASELLAAALNIRFEQGQQSMTSTGMARGNRTERIQRGRYNHVSPSDDIGEINEGMSVPTRLYDESGRRMFGIVSWSPTWSIHEAPTVDASLTIYRLQDEPASESESRSEPSVRPGVPARTGAPVQDYAVYVDDTSPMRRIRVSHSENPEDHTTRDVTREATETEEAARQSSGDPEENCDPSLSLSYESVSEPVDPSTDPGDVPIAAPSTDPDIDNPFPVVRVGPVNPLQVFAHGSEEAPEEVHEEVHEEAPEEDPEEAPEEASGSSGDHPVAYVRPAICTNCGWTDDSSTPNIRCQRCDSVLPPTERV